MRLERFSYKATHSVKVTGDYVIDYVDNSFVAAYEHSLSLALVSIATGISALIIPGNLWAKMHKLKNELCIYSMKNR